MSVEKIKIGNIVNDGLGDDLRTAFIKVNNNFGFVKDELEALVNEIETTGNGVSIFNEQEGSILRFKSLTAGQYITITDEGDTIRIGNSAPTAFTSITTENGTIVANTHPAVTFQGGDDVAITALGSVITVSSTGIGGVPFSETLQIIDFGELDTPFALNIQLAIATANLDFGLIDTPGLINLDLGTI